MLQSAATIGDQSASGDYGSGGQMELSQQFGCGSPSELSKHKRTSFSKGLTFENYCRYVATIFQDLLY